MKHLEALQVMPRYFEGELDRETTRAFHEHLNQCTDCQDQIRTLKRFKNKEKGKTAPLSPGRKRTRLLKEAAPLDRGRVSSFNAHHLAQSRQNQRRLVYQVMLAAGLFYFLVRTGVLEQVFK